MSNSIEERTKGSKYPKQCWAAQTKSMTLSLETELCLPEKDDKYPPFTMHGLYSRFKLVMILPPKTDGKRDVIHYNIRHNDEIAYFIEQYKLAKLMQFTGGNNGGSAQESQIPNSESPAYTVVFGSGNKKGKTAAQFLLEGGTIEELIESQAFYQKKLAQYPNNQEYIDAIDDAIYLYQTGTLNKTQTKNTSFVLISEKNKFMDTYKRDLTVTCVYGDNYPWKFDMAYHIVKDGKIVPGSTINGSYSLSDQQMAGLIFTMESIMSAYYANMYPIASQMSEEMMARLHNNQNTDPITLAVDDVLRRLRPSLIKALKGASDE